MPSVKVFCSHLTIGYKEKNLVYMLLKLIALLWYAGPRWAFRRGKGSSQGSSWRNGCRLAISTFFFLNTVGLYSMFCNRHLEHLSKITSLFFPQFVSSTWREMPWKRIIFIPLSLCNIDSGFLFVLTINFQQIVLHHSYLQMAASLGYPMVQFL